MKKLGHTPYQTQQAHRRVSEARLCVSGYVAISLWLDTEAMFSEGPT